MSQTPSRVRPSSMILMTILLLTGCSGGGSTGGGAATACQTNCPPVANAGPDQQVTTGQLVTLTGAGSTDPNDDPLTYSWRFQSKPAGSTATLAAATAVSPTFTADMAGSYVLSLVVSAGVRTSAPDTVVVGASLPFNQGSGFNGSVVSIVLAHDGSGDIYVGGEFTAYNGTVANRLIRLRPDGTVSQTFGQGFDGNVVDLALAKTGDGELYVLGEFTQFDGQPVPRLIRLTRSGSLDAGFRLPAELSSSLMPAFAVAKDGSRDLYVAFRISVPSSSAADIGLLNIVRLNPDGSVDPAFSTGNGFPAGSSRGCSGSITTLMPTSTGKLYVGGTLESYNGVPVSSLLRLNSDGTLDSTFRTRVGALCGVPTVVDLAPAGDGTADLYIGQWVGPLNRVHETGAADTSFNAALDARGSAIAVTQDGSGDVLLAASPGTLFRFNRHGALVTAPTFITPTTDGGVLTIVPLQDDTGDVYIGGYLTTYNGAAVNRFARIHADGSLASVVSGP